MYSLSVELFFTLFRSYQSIPKSWLRRVWQRERNQKAQWKIHKYLKQRRKKFKKKKSTTVAIAAKCNVGNSISTLDSIYLIFFSIPSIHIFAAPGSIYSHPLFLFSIPYNHYIFSNYCHIDFLVSFIVCVFVLHSMEVASVESYCAENEWQRQLNF